MTTQDRHRFYRDPQRGVLAGICAGQADYFGVDTRLVRLGWGIALLVFTLPTLLVYGVLAVALPVRPERPFADDEEARVHRRVHLSPHETLRETRHKFRDAEARLSRLEDAVLSEDVSLRRKFRDLG